MTVLLGLGLLLLIAIAIILGIAWSKPDTFHLERSIRVAAPPSAIMSHLVDFRKWMAWSPWEGKDPSQERTYSGVESGAGAGYAWNGNKDVGSGSMTITHVDGDAGMTVQLDFLKPFEAHNTVDFVLEPAGNETDVTWAMDGPHPLMMRAMSIFMPMEKMVGPDFEQGLASLKNVSEAESATVA